MTTTASKAGLKAAATTRTKKAAQRTPLPPKAGVVESAREPIAEEVAPATVKVPTPRKRAAKKVAEAPIASAPVDAPATQADPTAGDTKAHRNAGAFVEAGWTVTVQVDGEYAELVALRGSEIIHQAWDKGVYHNDSASYTISDRTVRTRNVAEAKRWAARTAAAAEAELAKVGSNTSFVKKAPASSERKPLPFDAKTVEEDAAWKAMTGKGVRWLNRLSNTEETAQVGADRRWFRIDEMADGERVLQFCCKAQGFRALRMGNILAVGKSRATKSPTGAVVLSVDVE